MILYIIIGIYSFVILYTIGQLLFYILPIKLVRKKNISNPFEPPFFYVKSFVFHIHTQFSYDSLGKPEDIQRALEKTNIDIAIITDHDNKDFSLFEKEFTIVGLERKITLPNIGIVGDEILLNGLRVVSHPFKKKYFWKLEKEKDLIVEIINLRDEIIKGKWSLFWRFWFSFIPLIFLKRKVLKHFLPVINVEKCLRDYFYQGWNNKVIGGLDHHVKLYLREVGIRALIFPYTWSFDMLRNFIYSKEKIISKKDVLKNIKEGNLSISFRDRPSFYWVENKAFFAYLPYSKSLTFLYKDGHIFKVFEKGYIKENLEKGSFIAISYTYLFKLGNIYFGIRPLALSNLYSI